MNKKIAIIGGGAAGFFAAINAAEKKPNYSVTIFEKGKNLLGKVKVSGGGRCNITHACFEPRELVKFYPRGQKELLGPFHTFMTGDTMAWFVSRGVELKIEDDNRIFPVSDNSQSIIDCLVNEAKKFNVTINTESTVDSFLPMDGHWVLNVNGQELIFDAVVIASGGNSSQIWNQLRELGYIIEDAIPSLFTFNTKDVRLRNLSGLSVNKVKVKVAGTKLTENGPLLVTHWGMSGPAILKLSAIGAKELAMKEYKFNIHIDWCPDISNEEVVDVFNQTRLYHPKKSVCNTALFEIPKRLWIALCEFCSINENRIWTELTQKEQSKLAEAIKNSEFQISGKSTNKEEFVTCGGVNLKQVNFSKFESKLHPNLFFAGEVLDIDALTGGFNFQAAWTSGYIVSQNI